VTSIFILGQCLVSMDEGNNSGCVYGISGVEPSGYATSVLVSEKTCWGKRMHSSRSR
jgi:hypothetical protein